MSYNIIVLLIINMTQVYKPSQILSVQCEFLHILVDLCKHPTDQDIEQASTLKPLPSHDLSPEITTVLTSWHFLLYYFPSICPSPSSISSHSLVLFIFLWALCMFMTVCQQISTALPSKYFHSLPVVFPPSWSSPMVTRLDPCIPLLLLPFLALALTLNSQQLACLTMTPRSSMAVSSPLPTWQHLPSFCSLYTGPTYTRHGRASGPLHLPSSLSGIPFSRCPCGWLLSPLELCSNSPPP